MLKGDKNQECIILSQRFEEYRKSKGLSYREIGEAFGKTEAAIRLASKRNSINQGFIRNLAKKFDLNLKWALTGEGEMINEQFRTEVEPESFYSRAKTIDEIIDEKVEKKIDVLREEILLVARSIILQELKKIKNTES